MHNLIHWLKKYKTPRQLKVSSILMASYILAGVKGERRAKQERSRRKKEWPDLTLKALGNKVKKKKKCTPQEACHHYHVPCWPLFIEEVPYQAFLVKSIFLGQLILLALCKCIVKYPSPKSKQKVI